MTLSENGIFFICSVLEKLPTIMSTHFLCLKKIIITTIRITKYPGNYKETTRNLPLSGKASGMYVANYPFPNPHFYFDGHSL